MYNRTAPPSTCARVTRPCPRAGGPTSGLRSVIPSNMVCYVLQLLAQRCNYITVEFSVSEYCFHKHFSFEGQPIPNCAADDVQSVHDCRSRCIRTKSCKYFTWHQRAKTCTLYSSASNLFLSNDALVRRNAISGYLYCPKDWNRLEESSCHHQSTGCYE